MTDPDQPFENKSLNERLDVNFALQAAGLGVWEVNPVTNQVQWDDKCRGLFGIHSNSQFPYQDTLRFIHPDDVYRVNQAVQWAMNPQSGGDYQMIYRTIGEDGRTRWIQSMGRSHFDPSGQATRFAGIAQEVTESVLTHQRIAKSEARFRSVIEKTPVATAIFYGKELIIELANEVMIGYWQKGPSVVGKPYRQAVPELVGQGYFEKLDDIFRTGQEHHDTEARADIVENGVTNTYYFNYSYTPLFDEEGAVYAVLNMGTDVTQQVLARQQLEESERFARTIFYNSPVAKLVSVGADMILREANEKMLTIFGRDGSILGNPLLEAIPELKRTQLIEQYREVLATGKIHREAAQHIELIKNGESYWGYYDYTYKPLLNVDGYVYGVICTMIEVTEQVLARQKLEEAEADLRGAVEMAQLGTWSIDVATKGLTYSDRLIEWFGYDPGAKAYNQVIPIIQVEDQERIARAMAWAMNPESNGIYDEIYTIIHPQTGQKRILHAHGRTVFDASHKAIRMNGTVQDITLQQELQLALEAQVQERTEELEVSNEELAATNEELAASNEEYAAINEELEEANGLLLRSNDNLQQFAYVASHDLQEPLRKIQQFGDLLKSQYTTELGAGVDYLERMQVAARRMSVLIKDLLTFSRISTQRDTSELVSLTGIVEEVVSDLELTIQETKAVIRLEALPSLKGDASQLRQLFQNLLSNALKFRRRDESGGFVNPLITISAGWIAADNLPQSVKPARRTVAYHRIQVSDNGIGFDEKYLDRIFQVFQRLHGKNEFSGTGIGLAICEKVVTNHGGAITASSQPGQGATFTIYLPL